MSGLRRALAYSGGGVYLTTAIGVVSTMILARLLRPEEVGVFAVAAGVLAMVSVFRDFGVSHFIIREPEFDRAKHGTCFAFTLALGWLIAGLFIVAAEPLARFYGEPGLRKVMLVQAACLFVIPFNSTQLALLKRERRFDHIFRIDVTSTLVHAAVAIGLALAGASYMALAWAAFASVWASLFLTQWLSAPGARVRPRLSHWRAVARFGSQATTISFVNNATNALPELIVGKLLGLHHAGLLSRALGLLRPLRMLVVGAADPVIYAHAAQKHRDGGSLAADYLRSVSYLAVIAPPFFAFLILMALPLVRVLFGPYWDATADIVGILAISGMCMPFFAFNQSFFVSIGKMATHLRILLALAPFKIASWLLAAPFGLQAAVGSFVIAHIVHTGLSLALLCRSLGVGLAAVLAAARPAVPVTLASAVAPLVLRLTALDDGWGQAWVLFVAATGAATGWLVSIFALRHPFRHEIATALARLVPALRRVDLPR